MLRTWVTDQPGRGPPPPGLALILRRGLPAWLAAWATWLPAVASVGRPLAVPMAQVAGSPQLLTVMLATMVEQCFAEGRR